MLVCPVDKSSLQYIEQENVLYNPRLMRKYQIVDDIPVMLVDESELVDEDEHNRLIKLLG